MCGYQLIAVGLFIAMASQPANPQSSALDSTSGADGQVTAKGIARRPDRKFVDADQRFVFMRRACNCYDVDRWHH